MNDSCCASGSCDCTSDTIQVDLLYLDLSICTRCQETESALEQAVIEVSSILEQTGKKVNVSKIHVTNQAQAQKLRLVSSPTIRVNERDIQLDVRESQCEQCGDLCGEDVDCRIWVWQGQEYTSPPKGMIIESLLREVYGSDSNNRVEAPQDQDVPDNLKRFFAAKKSEVDADDTNMAP